MANGEDKNKQNNKSLDKSSDILNKLDDQYKKLGTTIDNQILKSINKMGSSLENQLELQFKLNKGKDIQKDIEGKLSDLSTRRNATMKEILKTGHLSGAVKTQLLASVKKEFDLEKNILDKVQSKGKEKEEDNKKNEKSLDFFTKIANKLDKSGNLASIFSGDLDKAQISSALTAATFAILTEAAFSASDNINAIQKQTGLSYQEARKFTGELSLSAAESGKLFVTTKDLGKAFGELTKQTGLIADFGGKTLITQTTLTKQLGLSATQAGKLSLLSRLQSKDTEGVMKNTVGTVNALVKQSGVAVNVKGIIEEIANASDSIVVSLGNNPAALAEAATQAKLFGSNLAGVDAIAGNLLNFEQSINNELEFELLTGKQVNLEKARLLALNNDLAGLGEELANQSEITEAFATGNRIQQEAAAKALGMSRDELAKISLQQELNNLSAEEFKETYGETTYESLQAQSASEKFASTLEKVKGVIGDIGIIFAPIVDGFAFLVGAIASSKVGITAIATVLGVMGARAAALSVASMINAVGKIFAGNAAFGPVGIAMSLGGIAAMVATIAAVKSKTKGSMSDGEFDGGTISTKTQGSQTVEYGFKKDDKVVIGTDMDNTVPPQTPSDGSINVSVLHDSFQATSFMAEEGRHNLIGKHATGKMR